MKLWKFNGGIRLEGYKHLATSQLNDAKIPSQLIYPLQQRPGVVAAPVVKASERVLKGQLIAKSTSFIGAPIHAASSGIIKGIVELPVPHPSGLQDRCIVIDTDGQDEALPMQGIDDYLQATPDELRSRIREAGIVGLGGAVFPSAVKLDAGHRTIDTLVLNGSECEPYITCDNSLLMNDPRLVLDGAKLLLHILQIDRCLITVEDHAQAVVDILRGEACKPEYEQIEIVAVPTRYPTGGEKQLIQVVTGREVPSGGIPGDIGIVMQNVGTAAAIYQAITTGEPLISRLVTITGAGVKQPQNKRVLIGTPIHELIKECGGYTDEVERLIMGGPMMGIALSTDAMPIVKGTNCILAASHEEVTSDKQAMPCIRCGECVKVCPVHLLPQQLYWHGRAHNLDKAQEHNLFDCIECGCCEVVCPSHIPLVQYFRSSKSEIMTKNVEKKKAEVAKQRHDAQLERIARAKAERAERSRKKKEALKKKAAATQAEPTTANDPAAS